MKRYRWSAFIILASLLLICGFGWWLFFSTSAPYWHGSYVPKDLDDAHAVLMRTLPPDEIEKIKNFPSEDEMIEYHMGVGLDLRNEWGLWRGGRLARYFNNLGVYHPDDMSGIILDTFWCRLHDKPFRLDERVKYYQTYWKVVADPPSSAVTPKGHQVNWVQMWGLGTKSIPRAIHVGMDDQDQSFWVYEYDKGVYEPTPEMMDQIKRDDYWKTTYPELMKEKRQQNSDASSNR